jgi:MYXO-CTERM domain-containing protein
MHMRRTVAVLVGTLVALASVRDAHAGATLVTGLGGAEGFGTSCMPPNDDGSWPAGTPGLDLTPAFPKGLHFYSGSYTTAWINNNGNLSFQGPLVAFTPDAFPGAPEPMIAPYWADVDTRNGSSECDDGNYPSNGGYPAGATCTSGPDYTSAPATDGVWWSLTPGQMVVTWDQVGFYSCNTTPVMSFQMILSATSCGATIAPDGGVSGVDFNIEFRYNECGWEAGDASGGTSGFCPAGTVGTSCTPAQAGFDSAESPDTDYASLPMSRQAGISTELCTQSNLTPPQPGVWQFLVRGGQILCPTAGQACSTGQPGICAAGQITCGVNGATTCQPLTGPQPSQCNGLDNNCDGVIDTGPCPAGTVCDGTACVPTCTEVGCATGQTCVGGVCIETDCVGVTCTAGEVCQNGLCVDACSGVTCPIGQVCRLGNCVNPCAGLNCGTGQVCENGTCVPTCPCAPCSSTETCETTGPLAGQCVPTDCATITCGTGDVCQNGLCISACTGAVCPANQICQTGACVPNTTPVDSGPGIVLNLPEGGTGTLEDGGIEEEGGPGSTGGNGFDGGYGEGQAKASCGCRTTTASEGGGVALSVGVGLVAVLVRRRRRTVNRRGARAG